MKGSLQSVRIPATILLLAAAGCAVNPATGDRQLSFIGEGQEIEMGREADQQIVRSMGLYPDSSIQRYVNELGQELAAVSERPDLPWTFRVIDDPTVNAFAVPGGFIYLTRGIMAHLTSEAELVGILGHEIGHVTARHSVNQMSRQQLAQLGLGVGMVLAPELRAFGDLAGTGLQLLTLKFSRDDESQSDMLGVRYMRRTGYDPSELADVMTMLERASQIRQGGGRLPEWLSTHPNPENRVEHIQEMVAELPPEATAGARVAREAYMHQLDGFVFGADPREGFFDDDNTFHHPEMEFRLDFPAGWQTANQKTAVQAVSPEENAALLLTLSEGSPDDAFRSFASQEGVSVGDIREDRVNDIPALLAPFSARTEQGTLRGLVLFVHHEGTTFRILGYAPDQAWESYARVVERTLLSFRPETDPEVLAAQPDRLNVFELDRTLTVSRFMDVHPSTVRAEIVALINQVETNGTLPAGNHVKQVVSGR